MSGGDDFNARILEKGRERYEAGDKSELLYCLHHCIENNYPIPEWLKQAFRSARYAVHMYKVKSWDDVFGKPLKKGKRLKTERKKMEIAEPLWARIRKLHDEGQPIGKPLFAAVGKEFGVSGTVASEIYYALRRESILLAAEDDIINRK